MIFMISAVIAVIALIAVLFIKEIPLRRTIDIVPTGKDAAAPGEPLVPEFDAEDMAAFAADIDGPRGAHVKVGAGTPPRSLEEEIAAAGGTAAEMRPRGAHRA